MSSPLGTSRIYEGGYRRYDGPRLGAEHSFRSLWRHTVERIVGLRRPARTKVLPVLAILIAYLPPAVFIGLVAFLPDELRDIGPSYGEIYGFISLAILLFVTFVAPEALCPDRRSNVLSLYLASPLSRDTYLLAKAVAVFSSLLLVTLGPPLLLLIGRSMQSAGPDGITELIATLAKIVVASSAMAAVYTGLSLGIASVTDRRAWAAAGTFLFITVSNIVAGSLAFGIGAGDYFLLLSLANVPFELALAIHGDRGDNQEIELGIAVLAAGSVAWTMAGAAVAVFRYRRLQVTR